MREKTTLIGRFRYEGWPQVLIKVTGGKRAGYKTQYSLSGQKGELRLINFQSFDLRCSICRSNSSSLAQPIKLSDIISKVLFVGFRPVQRVMSMPAIRAQ